MKEEQNSKKHRETDSWIQKEEEKDVGGGSERISQETGPKSVPAKERERENGQEED